MGSSEKQRCNMAFEEMLFWQKVNTESLADPTSNHSWHKGQLYVIGKLHEMFTEIFEHDWPVERCQYCGDIMDGDVCDNPKCSVNQEES